MTYQQAFREYLKKNHIEAQLLPEEPMANHTSFRIGGPAGLMAVFSNGSDLEQGTAFLRESEIPFFIMGNGTNLLVSDRGIGGVVLRTFGTREEPELCEGGMLCPSGTLLSKAAVFAMKHGLTGLEFAHGIPGTIGGAVFMNAGAYGGEMSQVTEETFYQEENGSMASLKREEHCFGYRKSAFSGTGRLILKTRLRLKQGEPEKIRAVMDDLAGRRREKQPLDLPSAGSVFKRPEGYFAGKLIEDSGLRGYCVGGAQVSEKHCGFIVNRGGATCCDVEKLICHIQETVREKFGVELECEIRRIGL